MLDIAFRNTRRQKTRSFLTILGIVIGIAAIVALGAISEGLNYMVAKQMESIAGKIIIYEKGSSMMTGYTGSDITQEDVDELADMDGIKDVIPMIFYMLDSGGGFQFSQPYMAIGLDPDKQDYFRGEKVGIEDGRELEEGDSGVTMVGKKFAEGYNLEVGDYVTINEEEFYVVGIVEQTDNGDIDNSAMIPLQELKDLIGSETYPFLLAIPEDIDKAEDIAEDIKDQFEDFDVITEKELARTVAELMSNIQIFTFGIGGIAAFVGGLGVMNTMIMAVLERRREIGVFKAIGATDRMILRQFLTESALLSVIGGLLGIALGCLAAVAMGILSGFAATPVITPGLLAGSFTFALALGLFGGLYPSIKAASLDPVEALRYE